MTTSTKSPVHNQVLAQSGLTGQDLGDAQVTTDMVDLIITIGDLVKPGTDITALAKGLKYFQPEHIALALDQSSPTRGLARIINTYKSEFSPVVIDALYRCFHR